MFLILVELLNVLGSWRKREKSCHLLLFCCFFSLSFFECCVHFKDKDKMLGFSEISQKYKAYAVHKNPGSQSLKYPPLKGQKSEMKSKSRAGEGRKTTYLTGMF